MELWHYTKELALRAALFVARLLLALTGGGGGGNINPPPTHAKPPAPKAPPKLRYVPSHQRERREGQVVCPNCHTDSQVWENQITGKLTCHRAHCHIELE